MDSLGLDSAQSLLGFNLTPGLSSLLCIAREAHCHQEYGDQVGKVVSLSRIGLRTSEKPFQDGVGSRVLDHSPASKSDMGDS